MKQKIQLKYFEGARRCWGASVQTGAKCPFYRKFIAGNHRIPLGIYIVVDWIFINDIMQLLSIIYLNLNNSKVN